MSLPSARSTEKQARNQHEAGSKLTLKKCPLTFNGLHDIISQKTTLHVKRCANLKSSNPASGETLDHRLSE
jgi:hypothetical protein